MELKFTTDKNEITRPVAFVGSERMVYVRGIGWVKIEDGLVYAY